MEDNSTRRIEFEREVEARFGVLPHFFQSAPDCPDLVRQLWIYAKAAYLDNPLPSLFKERVFVYLSRFCEMRYCIVRHVGFLVGRGRPSGDAAATPESVEQILRLLRRPVPSGDELQRVLSNLSARAAPFPSWPAPGSQEEGFLIAAATTLFLEPARAAAAKEALRHAVGPTAFEQLVGLLSFIRTAHYWTVLHPELAFEEDVELLLREHASLAELLLDDPEAGRCEMGQRLFEELATLREVVGLREAVRESELANLRLREMHRHKDSFIAVVGHEIRNPISAIRTASEVLGLLDIEDARLDEVRAILRRQTAAVARLADDLFDVSRVSLDKLSIHREPLDLRTLLGNSLNDHRASFAATGLDLRVELPLTPVRVRADRVRALQVFENLLSNALRFTPPPGEVSVRMHVENGHAVVEVADTGVGFDAELAKTFFLPFVQAPGQAQGHGGLGLGLAIGRRIAELHGGSLSAASAGRSRGARFTWTIELDLDPPLDISLPAVADDAARSRRRILLVEDDRDAARALHLLLELAGHDVRLAHDGASALEQLGRWQPDAVLCDLSLSKNMSGLEFARACRQDPRLEHLRLIAVSGYCSPADADEARAAGFECLLGKPVELDTIDTTLRATATTVGARA